MKSTLAFLILLPLVLCDYSLFMGFDTIEATLGQDFFDCAAGRINYNRNGFAIIPYTPTADFAGQVIKAKKAGFLEVHLLLDPNQISIINPQVIAQNTLSALRNRGTGVSGIWLDVSSNSLVWNEDSNANINTILGVLSAFQQTLRSNFGDVKAGVYTTSYDWKSVTKSDSTKVSGAGYLYWSKIGDSVNCDTGAFGFQGCYLQQIQASNYGCNSAMNIDVKRIVNTQ